MEKMIKPVISAIDNFMPGMKTYAIMLIAMGMLWCEGHGHHVFSAETWGMMGVGAMATWKMGVDRGKK